MRLPPLQLTICKLRAGGEIIIELLITGVETSIQKIATTMPLLVPTPPTSRRELQDPATLGSKGLTLTMMTMMICP